jgi:hypothetical protein
MPLWCLPWGEIPPRWSWRAAAILILLAGVGVQLIATFTNTTPAYADAFAGASDPDDETRYAMVHYALDKAPLVAGVRRAWRGQWEDQAIYHLQGTDLTADWVYGVPQAVERGFAISLLVIGWAWWRNPDSKKHNEMELMRKA